MIGKTEALHYNNAFSTSEGLIKALIFYLNCAQPTVIMEMVTEKFKSSTFLHLYEFIEHSDSYLKKEVAKNIQEA